MPRHTFGQTFVSYKLLNTLTWSPIIQNTFSFTHPREKKRTKATQSCSPVVLYSYLTNQHKHKPMSHARDEQGPTRQTDEFGNQLPQPSTTAMYGGPSTKGGASFGLSTGDADAFTTGYYGGQPQQEHQPRAQPQPGTDPTSRRGTTTGEYGTSGIGLMDRAKEKLGEIGGFKENPGHVTTAGEPMETSKG